MVASSEMWNSFDVALMKCVTERLLHTTMIPAMFHQDRDVPASG